jgi:hypothetical protein
MIGHPFWDDRSKQTKVLYSTVHILLNQTDKQVYILASVKVTTCFNFQHDYLVGLFWSSKSEFWSMIEWMCIDSTLLFTSATESQSVGWKTVDLLSLTDLLRQYWQPVLTELCFYFTHSSTN